MRFGNRISVLVLSLSAGSVALCQSSAPHATILDKAGAPAKTFDWAGTDFSKIAPRWNANGVAALPMMVQRTPGPALGMDSALAGQLDSGIIHRPTKDRLGTQPEGTAIARNEFPGLQFLPIESVSRKVRPISIVWPNFKIKPIPLDYPDASALPAAKGGRKTKAGPSQ